MCSAVLEQGCALAGTRVATLGKEDEQMAENIKGIRPRIGVDLHTLEGLHQGTRTHCLELFPRVITRLPEIDFVFFVDIARWSDSYVQAFTTPNARIVNMPHSNPIARLSIHLPALTKRHSIDLLHTQYICPPIAFAKTAVTIHDILFEDYPQYFKPIMRLRSHFLFQLSALKSDLIFTVSDYSKSQLATRYHLPTKRLATIYNGANIGRFFPGNNGREQVEKLGLVAGEYLLSVGRLEPRKNHLGLLRAVALLEGPRPKLVIVGQRDFWFEEIFSLCKQLRLQDDVVFLEAVEDGLLASLYRNAKLCIYVSFAEGFGMPIIEAMASGTPVITSDTTSLPEISGGAAILVDPHSPESIRRALETVLTNDKLATEMKARGLERTKLFSWDSSADILANEYYSYFFHERQRYTHPIRA